MYSYSNKDADQEALDYALALSLSEDSKVILKKENDDELDAAIALSLSENANEDQDFKFAQNLQRKLDKDSASKFQNQSAHLLPQFENNKKQVENFYAKDIEALKPLLEHPAVKGENNNDGALTDAHTYTKTEIRASLPTIINIDEKYKLSNASLSAEQVLQEVLAFVSTLPAPMRPNVDNIRKTFSYIPKNAPIESSETNANIPQLLSRTWSLAKFLETKLGVRDARKQIAEILDLNIADQGKCMPGLIARLYSPYAKMVDFVLKASVQEASVHVKEKPKAFTIHKK